MKLQNIFVVLFLILVGGLVWSAPAQVIIIRHAEKPDEGNQLSSKGFQRAKALPQFFANNPLASQFGKPVAIYAATPKADDPNGSIRSIQTVTPLAQSLGLKINGEFTKDEVQNLVQEIMGTPSYDGRTVVICWEHKMIIPMAQYFGVQNPPKWPSDVFDRAWILNFSGIRLTSFQNIAEHLLPGDS